jgi:succinyl-CoA synthetase beta subunit
MNQTEQEQIADEQPHDEYAVAIKCKHVVGARGKQCGAIRFCKPQDVFQVTRCRTHAPAHKAELRRARAKAKREAQKASA